jgi:hypothetical protein
MFLQQNRNGVKIQYENNLSTQKKKFQTHQTKFNKKELNPKLDSNKNQQNINKQKRMAELINNPPKST